MLDKSRKDFEEVLLKKIPESIGDIKKELTPLLDKRLEVESVVKDSVDLLDTDVINRAAIQDSLNDLSGDQAQGQSNTKQKVMVRTMNGPSHFHSETKATSDENTYSYPSYGISEDQSNWRSGNTDTLILMATGVLVLLVFVVSYLMLNYFG